MQCGKVKCCQFNLGDVCMCVTESEREREREREVEFGRTGWTLNPLMLLKRNISHSSVCCLSASPHYSTSVSVSCSSKLLLWFEWIELISCYVFYFFSQISSHLPVLSVPALRSLSYSTPLSLLASLHPLAPLQGHSQGRSQHPPVWLADGH